MAGDRYSSIPYPRSDFVGLPDLSMVPIAEVKAIGNRYDWEEVRRQLSLL
jgi:hypothetical protein